MTIDAARHRLEALHHDVTETQIAVRITPDEANALRTILDELHRLHVVVAAHDKIIRKRKSPRKKLNSKPAGARSQPATARGTTQNKRRNDQ